MSTIAEYPMAKRKDVAVKIDAEVARMGKIVAAFEGKSLAEYLSDSLRPIVEAAFRRHIRQAQPPDEPKSSRR